MNEITAFLKFLHSIPDSSLLFSKGLKCLDYRLAVENFLTLPLDTENIIAIDFDIIKMLDLSNLEYSRVPQTSIDNYLGSEDDKLQGASPFCAKTFYSRKTWTCLYLVSAVILAGSLGAVFFAGTMNPSELDRKSLQHTSTYC